MSRGYGSFAAFYDPLMNNVEYDRMASFLDSVIMKHGGKRGALLDLACGTGSLAEELSKLGYSVTGADVSEEMLSEAMEKKLRSGSDIMYIRQDMTRLDLPAEVDVTVCTLDSLNHLEGFNDVMETFKRVYEFTSKGGLFVFDMNTVYKHREILSDNSFVFENDEVFCIWQNENDGDTVNISLDFFVLGEDGLYERFSEDFSETAYPVCEITNALSDTGFTVEGVYDEFTFNEPSDTSERVIFCAKKTGK